MRSSFFVSTALLGVASASPVAHPDATITPAPTLVERQDAVQTTYALSSCYVFQDPDQGGDTGCYCSGYASLLPLSSGSSTCDYTQYVTSVTTATDNGYPFTTTESNGDVIAYAASTIYYGNDPADAVGVGSSTTIWTAPTPTTTVQIGSDLIQIGDLGNGGSNWTDPLTSALVALCPGTDSQCTDGYQSIETTYYPSGSYGHIDVSVLQSNYSGPDQANALIGAVVWAFGQAASSTNCQFPTWAPASNSCGGSNGFGTLTCGSETQLQCASANFVSAQILSEINGSPAELGQLNVQLSYSNDNPETWNCVDFIKLLALDVGLIPGAAILGGTVANTLGGVAVTCQNGEDPA